MASLLSMLRIETPMMSGRKARAVSRARRTGSRAKQRSRKRTLLPAASSAEATHASPLGTTGYGWRSRLVLTGSTRGPSTFWISNLDVMTYRANWTGSGQQQGHQCPGRRTDGIDRIVVKSRDPACGARGRPAAVDATLGILCAYVAPPPRLERA